MKKTIICWAIALATLQGCISINSNGFNQLSPAQKQKVARPGRPLEQLTLCDTIYIVNDKDVRMFLEDKDLAIVAHYLTWCTSELCIRPSLEHERLTQTGLPFLMIAGDFASAEGYDANYPFITIDSEYYNTKRYTRSLKRMFQALGCGDNWWHSYILFRRGEYVCSGRTLDEIMQSTH